MARGLPTLIDGNCCARPVVRSVGGFERSRVRMSAAVVEVIDDEPMIRWAIAQTLAAAGYEVLLAATAADGIAQFEARQPSVVFVDMRLPDGDGLTLLRQIKDRASWGCAVIFMTAFADMANPDDVTKLGAHCFLPKPFEFERLEGLVAEALAASAQAA